MAAGTQELLEGVSIFGGLSDETLEFLADRLEPVVRAAGEYFFREGDVTNSVYVIESGTAEVVKSHDGEDFVFVTFEPGACFGETALVEIAPQIAGIRAATDCETVALRGAVLHELSKRDLEQFTLVQMNLAREIARRFTILGQVLFDHSMLTRKGKLGPLASEIHKSMK